MDPFTVKLCDDAEAVRQARIMLQQCLARQVSLDLINHCHETLDLWFEDKTCMYDSVMEEIRKAMYEHSADCAADEHYPF